MLGSDAKPLKEKEQKIVNEVRRLANHGTGSNGILSNGKLLFVHGVDGVPVIIAAPLQVVDIELQPGEQVNEIVLGDAARWQMESGSAGNTTHLFVKPVDIDLETTAVVTTDRRVYHFRLLSRKADITPYVGFLYHDDLKAQVAAAQAKNKKQKEWESTDTGVNLADLNFAYELEGDAPWKPARVFDDGSKMYIQLPKVSEMPALMVRRGQKDVLVNYRVKDRQTMEVDGVFPHLALVVGVGLDQEIVEIFKKGYRRNTGHFTGPPSAGPDRDNGGR